MGFAVPIANTLELLGETVAAGTNPFRSIASGNTVTYQAQISQAIAATDATKIGLAAFDSDVFSVDASGFVGSFNTPLEVVTNSGTAIPVANVLNLLGTGEISISAVGNTITVTSSDNTWIDQGSNTTLVSNTNYFATAAVTLTLPSTPSQGNEIEIYVDTASSVVMQASAGQTIRIGSATSSVAGTLTNTQRGDYLKLIYRSTGSLWAATGSGTWTPA